MKPTRLQYFLAEDWPAKACRLVTAMLSVAVVISVCQPSRPLFNDGPYLLLFSICIFLSPILGFFLSMPVAWLMSEPLYQYQVRLNGAPFRPGDRIRILVGPHRDCVVRVYDVWESRSQVRVELGEPGGREVQDVFDFTQVCREG